MRQPRIEASNPVYAFGAQATQSVNAAGDVQLKAIEVKWRAAKTDDERRQLSRDDGFEV